MEKNVKIKVSIIGLSSFLFLIGGMIYLMFRSESLVMFRWCEKLGVREYVIPLRMPHTLPEWIIYSLPDGLWLSSYVLFVSVIWDFDLKKGWPYIFSLPIIAICTEFAQAFDWVEGTFDWVDLICYLLGVLLGVVIIKYLKFKENEKEKHCI